MSKQVATVENSTTKQVAKPQPTIDPVAGMIAFTTGDYQDATSHLMKSHFSVTHRQALANQIGSVHGNTRLQRKIAINQRERNPASLQRVTNVLATNAQPSNVIQRETDNEKADARASDIYSALDGWDNEMAALKAIKLAYHTHVIDLVSKHEKFKEYGSLHGYLKDQLSGDYLIKAYALLHHGDVHAVSTALALALISDGIQDDAVDKHMHMSAFGIIEKNYNKTFGKEGNGSKYLGQGTLKEDVKSRLTGWLKQKSLALLNRGPNLTEADKLYFDSVGIVGTKDDSVVQRIQSLWKQGPTAITKLESDWNAYVRNENGWTDEPWTTLPLRAAMKDELWPESAESWKIVETILDGADQSQSEPLKTDYFSLDKLADSPFSITYNSPQTENDIFKQENIQLSIAERIFDVAVEGSGTNEGQINHAISTMREIWQKRIKRTDEQNHDSQKVSEYRATWEKKRTELLTRLRSGWNPEMDEDGADYRQVALLSLGNLSPADELYLASQKDDDDRVVELITQYWALNKLDQVMDQACVSRIVSGKELRPSFSMYSLVTGSGLPFQRILAMTGEGGVVSRGVERIKLELKQGNSEDELKNVYALLTIPGIRPGLRDLVVNTYADEYLTRVKGETGKRKFLNYVSSKYEWSTTHVDFRDLLEPTTDPEMKYRRAEQRYKASHSGFFDPVLTLIVSDIDRLTGNDTLQVAQESLDRLRYIAQQSKAQPEELEVLMAEMSASNVEQLASMEYGAFQSRLEAVRQLKHTIAEALATYVELVVEAALTVATAGVAGGALITSLASAVAGMVAREAFLGNEYDLTSADNAKQLASMIITAGFNKLGEQYVKEMADLVRLQRLGHANMFLQKAATEAIANISTNTLVAGFDSKMPSEEDIYAAAISIIGNSFAEGVGGSIEHNTKEVSDLSSKIRQSVTQRIAQNVISGTAETGAELVRSGSSNLTGEEITKRFLGSTTTAVTKGVIKGVSNVAANEVEATRKHEAKSQQHTLPSMDSSMPTPDLSIESRASHLSVSDVGAHANETSVPYQEGLEKPPSDTGEGWKLVTLPAGTRLYAVGERGKTPIRWGAFQEHSLIEYVAGNQWHPSWGAERGQNSRTPLVEYSITIDQPTLVWAGKVADQPSVGVPQLGGQKIQYYRANGLGSVVPGRILGWVPGGPSEPSK